MKIGILTIHDSPNYGACLQCYALWKYLTNQGYDCDVIDLHRPGAHPDYIPSKRYTRCRPLTQSIFTRLKKFVKQAIGKKTRPVKYYNDEAKKKFDAFNSLCRKSLSYRGPDELYSNPPNYDVYIAGSDQLWNPTQPYCIEPYFLTFVDGEVKRKVSFATSIGITELTISEKNKFKAWLSDFTAISVREKQAKELLESFVGRSISQVSDPTFLLTPHEWGSLAISPNIDKPYILYFALHIDENLLCYCKRLSDESGLPLYVLNQTHPVPQDSFYVAIKDAGPREFIGFIAEADLVITDSFHGTVFSIIMGAQNFYSYIAMGNKRGSRIEGLLTTFGLSEHLLKEPLNMTFKELDSHIVNQDKNGQIVDKIRKEGTAFLTKSICQ